MTGLHTYTDQFFEYIERGSIGSAQRITKFVAPLLNTKSVLDVGCGRGAWLNEWRNAGVEFAHGIDGPYVQRSSLLIPERDFRSVDLSEPFELNRQYDLVTCLEVAEHLPSAASEGLVSSLVRHSGLVLFSAATPGQGGENHINEKPLAYWQGLFLSHGYSAFDIVRPVFRRDPVVEPWYKFNTLLYASDVAASLLSESVVKSKVAQGQLRETGSLTWRARRAVLGLLPQATVTSLARWNAKRVIAARSPSSERQRTDQ
jgi:SAM-dependent methyltransferase